jgi:GTP-binding protein Era
MLLEDQHPHNKAIMVAVLGAPNVGKSSLINVLLGTDLTVVTNKPQTTRNKFHCVLTVDRTEIVLVDTPGLHKSNQEFNKRLNEQAREGTEGADLNLLLIDISRDVLEQFVEFKENIDQELGPTWVVFTKSDKVENAENLPLAEVVAKAKEILPSLEKHFVISNKEGTNIHELTGAICDRAEPGPHLYPNGDISNKNQRFFVTEYIREQAFELLKDEVPYEVAVVIDEYKEVKGKTDPEAFESHISASILVNRPSQRAIVIGSSGSMIKEIGIRSRKKIEVMTGGPVHLNLHVKVSPKWFKNNFVLEEIGLPRAKDSARVWRKK